MFDINDYKQIVYTPTLFQLDETFEDERFCKVRIAAMHTGINRNGSRFSKSCIEKAKNTFKNIPVLADVQEYTDEEGNTYLDYSGHTMHVEDDKFNEDTQRIIYDEKIVGVIPEVNNFELKFDDSTGNYYVYVDALLYREYGNYCVDILEKRGGETEVSMEIGCDNVSYSAKDKCLDVGIMTACAVTLLGNHVTAGMAKAHAEMFSLDKDSRELQMIKIMQELKESLDNYTNAIHLAENTKEGGTDIMNHLEELLAKYNITIESIDFEYENMTDEELDSKFEELFGAEEKSEEAEEQTEEQKEEENIEEPVVDSEEIKKEESEIEVELEENIEQEESIENNESDNSITYSVSYGKDNKKEYAVSLSDIQYALYELVNATYADENSYYSVEVYMDEQYVIMIDYWTGKAYKQSYKCKKKNYSLYGDRVQVKAVYITEDEENELEKMRSNYSSISEKLEKYELEPLKVEILNSDDYKKINDTKEFIELKEYHFDLSLEEVTRKADEILLSYAKNGKIDFSNETKSNRVPLSKKPNVKGRYGNLFSK